MDFKKTCGVGAAKNVLYFFHWRTNTLYREGNCNRLKKFYKGIKTLNLLEAIS